ncbi:hypothetical protein Tco_1066231 [Tanacetum coccineum]|uniref:Uncharacterized protein n=1 Tax=Tanacetum coccineum TaxID=301880 RepID=A0ABQ5HA97_9ASTR
MGTITNVEVFNFIVERLKPCAMIQSCRNSEVTEGGVLGVPQFIVNDTDGFPIQPVPRDEDEREPRFIEDMEKDDEDEDEDIEKDDDMRKEEEEKQ